MIKGKISLINQVPENRNLVEFSQVLELVGTAGTYTRKDLCFKVLRSSERRELTVVTPEVPSSTPYKGGTWEPAKKTVSKIKEEHCEK